MRDLLNTYMLVIGNGESRKDVKIDKLEGSKVGCNAIMRDYTVDYLVCVDKRMVEEAINRQVNLHGTLVYTRPDWYSRYQTLRVRKLPNLPYNGTQRADEPFQWGSGPYAVLLGAKYTRTKEVKLLGFDLYSTTKTVNNVYKDTPNYDKADKRAVDPRYWIHQIGKVFECFPKITFTIYQDNWELPQAWNYPNVQVDKISNIM
jgi:hypothetical protein